MSEEQNIIWEPLPGSQELAISCPCHHILYEGTRGPGKTDAQLMRFRRRVGQGYGIFWRGVIFDREYKMLDDLVLKSKKWFNRFGDGATWLSSGKDYKWVWPSGILDTWWKQCEEQAREWSRPGMPPMCPVLFYMRNNRPVRVRMYGVIYDKESTGKARDAWCNALVDVSAAAFEPYFVQRTKAELAMRKEGTP